MTDTTFLYFSFIAGLAAFFAPCSFAMLPGYVSYYISRQPDSPNKLYNNNFLRNAARGFVFGAVASLGFAAVFGAAGFAVIAIGQIVKQIIPWIAVITGAALVLLGTAMLFGKKFMLFQIPKISPARKNEKFGVFLFGIAYAIGSLGCVFPIFLSIAIQGVASSSFLEGAYTILSYIAGMSIVMTAVTTATFSARFAIIKKIDKAMPYLNKISALILVVAGIYMIYYQYLLLR